MIEDLPYGLPAAVPDAVLTMAAELVPLAPMDERLFPPRQESGVQFPSLPPALREDTKWRCPFEVYVVGLNSGNTSATVACATGTVIANQRDVDAEAAITDLHTSFAVADGDKVWLHAEFDSGGTLTGLTLKHGEPTTNGWTAYPDPIVDNGAAGNEWFHLIAEVGDWIGAKNSFAQPDSGEQVIYPTAALTIRQLTHTHLAVSKECIGLTRESFWILKPWHGAVL